MFGLITIRDFSTCCSITPISLFWKISDLWFWSLSNAIVQAADQTALATVEAEYMSPHDAREAAARQDMPKVLGVSARPLLTLRA